MCLPSMDAEPVVVCNRVDSREKRRGQEWESEWEGGDDNVGVGKERSGCGEESE